ncbi:MAG: NAD(P)/FAD-dependent oxidoreductase, partial [Aeromicrobium sp.]
FLNSRAIDVDGRQITFRRAVIATGSSPTIPPIDALAGATVVTSDSVWDLQTLPRRLLVVGGGAIGCELGQAFARLGSTVTIAEAGERLLPHEAPDAAAVVAAALAADGITVLTGATVDADVVAGADVVLVAAGRAARVDSLDLAEADVDIAASGDVVVDARLRTTNKRIWAAGDVTGHPPFTHLAGVHGSLAATNAVLGLRRTVDLSAVPRVLYTQPEVAAVGVDRASDDDGHERVIQHAEVDRAVAEGQVTGFSRLVLGRRGKVIGGCIVGPRAGESLAEVTLAVQHGMTARDIAATIHPYPTYGDGVWNAALAQLREDLEKPWLQRIAGLLLRWRRRGA